MICPFCRSHNVSEDNICLDCSEVIDTTKLITLRCGLIDPNDSDTWQLPDKCFLISVRYGEIIYYII